MRASAMYPVMPGALQLFVRDHYRPESVIITIVTDLATDEVRRMMEHEGDVVPTVGSPIPMRSAAVRRRMPREAHVVPAQGRTRGAVGFELPPAPSGSMAHLDYHFTATVLARLGQQSNELLPGGVIRRNARLGYFPLLTSRDIDAFVMTFDVDLPLRRYALYEIALETVSIVRDLDRPEDELTRAHRKFTADSHVTEADPVDAAHGMARRAAAALPTRLDDFVKMVVPSSGCLATCGARLAATHAGVVSMAYS